MRETNAGLYALDFVNSLVPGRFESARARLDPECEYHYAGAVLRGEAIVDAFEQSHAKAAADLDEIEYLPGIVDSIDADTVIIKVFDRIRLKDKTHTYSDRLVVTVRRSPSDVRVVRIEHRPFEEERRKLREFFEENGVTRS